MKKTVLATLAVIALTSVSSAAFAQSNIAGRNRPEGLTPIVSPAAKPPPNANPLVPTAPPQIKTMPAGQPTSTQTQRKDRPADALHGGACATGGSGGGGVSGVGGWCR